MKGRKTGGRVAGTPNKATAELKDMARQYTEEAVLTFAHVMRNGDSDQAKIAAADKLLDRGWGKPSQPASLDVGLALSVEIRQFVLNGNQAPEQLAAPSLPVTGMARLAEWHKAPVAHLASPRREG